MTGQDLTGSLTDEERDAITQLDPTFHERIERERVRDVYDGRPTSRVGVRSYAVGGLRIW